MLPKCNSVKKSQDIFTVFPLPGRYPIDTKEKGHQKMMTSIGAENETRTRDPNLGKVVLYQLSYFRIKSL